ncbi:MAG: preprotein translocase subunit SecA [Omnitrophica bacterium RIFCSPHIGHO2_02_FULL_51_18]|nr:MAG: preprotein translocase subunit SecA [Omnitrophica bacterium RIFCSPHIGHO2_02_FULL_51_18]
MINWALTKIFGTQNDRMLKRYTPFVQKINSFEAQISSLSDDLLKVKTQEFRDRLNKGQTLKDILPEAFAVVRETSKRLLNMRHFDVQLVGGMVLNDGKIAEMATGEGKTLVATLPVYLNGLTGKGVHVVTVNDYLAKRDREWMGPIYEFLGLSVGVIQHGIAPQDRQKAYGSDVVYGTNNEFGFDFLRDNMVRHVGYRVQRELCYAIVDEVDSILIDEARTPLIISGPSEESTDKYEKINHIIPRMNKEEDYQIEEKTRTVALTEKGVKKAEEALGVENLYDPHHVELVHHVNQALRAHTLFKKDVDYVVKDAEVLIVDEFTGRLMPGRRYSDGLHQALEAKEGVKVEEENQTLATVTFQNYFRMYAKLAGMTGTAATEAQEFHTIYKLDVVTVPTNRPMNRKNHADQIYRTEKEKFTAVVNEIVECHKKGQPVLVGTVSIEKSEHLSSMLRRANVLHNVLNAKFHEMEAEIIKQAGQPNTVTIATNMAGRGTDIVLGQGVRDVGGLHVVGTERHEARRIDNQLRGRSGRQGDPGSSRFYLSLEDDLMRIFGSDKISGLMQRLGMEEGQPIEHPFITRAIETAQKRVEGRNFEIRKQLLEYDNVMNKQREVIYSERKKVLEGENLREHYLGMIEEVTDSVAAGCDFNEDDAFKGLSEVVKNLFPVSLEGLEGETGDRLTDALIERAKAAYENKEKEIGADFMRSLERMILMDVVDSKWKEHLRNMDNLREGIGLRAYGQKDPLVEYKREAFEAFQAMIGIIKEDSLGFIFRVQPVPGDKLRELPLRKAAPMQFLHPEAGSALKQMPQAPVTPSELMETEEEAVPGNGAKRAPIIHHEAKVGRNDPCPCGSGKKYKKCHGQ